MINGLNYTEQQGTVLWAVLRLVLLVKVIDYMKSMQNSIRAKSNLDSYIANNHGSL